MEHDVSLNGTVLCDSKSFKLSLPTPESTEKGHAISRLAISRELNVGSEARN